MLRPLLVFSLLACQGQDAPQPGALVLPTEARPDAARPDAATPDGGAAKSRQASIAQYFRGRTQLDESLWANEELAQEHERYFIRLWDELRGGGDPVDLLVVPDATVVLPALGAPQSLSREIRRRLGGAPKRELSAAEWAAMLNAWRQQGYTLVQSEWHHRQFLPGTPNRSRFKIELHLTREKPAARLIVRSTLLVHWMPGDPPFPSRVEAHDVQVLERPGPPAFTVARSFPMGPNKPQSVLVDDLDGDGTLELILPSRNEVHSIAGDKVRTRRLLTEPGPDLTSATLADFTGDGFPDLLVASRPEKVSELLLYRGTDDGRFPAPPIKVFTDPELRRPRVLAPGDYDGDGDLDVWVTQYRGAYNDGRMPTPFHDANDGRPSYLLRNDGRNRFTEVTEKVGLGPLRRRHTQSASFFDLDRDGDADLLTVNDFAGVDLYRNDGGRFTLNTESWVDHRKLFGMAHALADLDRDGQLDLFATGMNSTTVRRLNDLGLDRPDLPDDVKWRTEMTFGNRFYRGLGQGRFKLAPDAPQVAASGWSWGTVAGDWDRDGRQDLFIANGFISGRTALDYCTQYWRHDVYLDDSLEDTVGDEVMGELIGVVESGISWNGFEHDRLFLQTPKGYVDVGFLVGLGHEADGRNVLSADLDRDGDLDLLVAQVERGGKLTLRWMRNDWPAKGNWITIRLQGTRGVSPLGARVALETSAGRRVAAVVAGDSFMVQHPTEAYFGLGSVGQVKRAVVTWPDGQQQIVKAPAVGRVHVVRRE